MTVDILNIVHIPPHKNNETKIEDAAVRYLCAGWYILIAFTALIGDTIILTASIRHNAIKLHEVLVAFIQHIAVTDLIASVIWLLPSAVSLIANKWVLGVFICNIRTPIGSLGNQAARLLICGMTTSKLLMLRYPLRSVSWSAGQAHKLCAGIWFLSGISCTSFSVNQIRGIFDFRAYVCMFDIKSRTQFNVIQPIVSTVITLIPSLVIVLTGSMILGLAGRVARQARQGLRWQGVLTVVLTATFYVISFLPRAVYHMAEPLVRKGPLTPYHFMVTYYRLGLVLLSFNNVSNLFIYCLAVASFRDFLRNRFQRLICQNQGETLNLPPIHFICTYLNLLTLAFKTL